ncbi:MAG: beta-propeller domain-containing protein, partial [Coriobacteriia bacterium]|nr:beta-propeller domain-containing protein [Coriobacteriia bacterium]
MKPKNFRDTYKHEMEEIQLDDKQLASLLSAIEAEELTQGQTYSSVTTPATEERAYSPTPASAPVKKQRKRFWKDWSTAGQVVTVSSGLVGATAMLFFGVVAWSAMSTLFLPATVNSTLSEPFELGEAAQTELPLEGMVALIPADNDYTNIYTTLEQIHERDMRELERSRAEAEQRREAQLRNDSSRSFFSFFGNDSDDMATNEEPLSEDMALDSADSFAPESEMFFEDDGGSFGGASSRDNPDFSDTNIQVQGVQEGDILKTNGHYIYALSTAGLTVIEANAGNPRVLSTLAFDDAHGPSFRPGALERQGTTSPRSTRSASAAGSENIYSKMYLEGDRLIALWAITNDPMTSVHFPEMAGVDIFDVSNPASPRYLTSFSLGGNLVNSRMIGDVLYLVCTTYIDDARRERGRPETFIPFVNHDDETILAPASHIRITPETREMRAKYTHIVGIDTSRGGRLVSQAALLGGSDDLYMSTDNLFLLSEGQIRKPARGADIVGNATTVTRVGLDAGYIDIDNSRRLPGIVNNQFSLDEKDDVLRIITTFTRWEDFSQSRSQGSTGRGSTGWDSDDLITEEWEPTSSDFTDTTVWTLDARLEIIGMIDGFGIDEDVYSARFMGDIVYFVTFREIDPVYAVDLSDPANPRFLSELKIPGFSEYLHPWTDGMLFGFGRDACEITGIRGGLKLSMFNISNPRDVTREHYLILDDYRDSDASSNHRAILVSPERNLIAFPADDSYMIYSFHEQRGFELVE